MVGLLIDARALERAGTELAQIAADAGTAIDAIAVPAPDDPRLDASDLARIEIAFFSTAQDVRAGRRFFGAANRAPNLRWLHVGHAGIDAPVFGQLLERGVRLTNSAGASAEPIAQSAIGGMLVLARGFHRWREAQRDHEWRPHAADQTPQELRGQTLVVLGLGAIGGHIARVAQSLGLYVIGVRRRPRATGDTAEELVHPDQLADVLPRADWLAVTAPLTDSTRGVIDAEALSLLPAGARVINVARGEIFDEPALIESLRSGHLGGAYLDVFAEEPLPPSSPLWDLPNVVISPHNSAASTGNRARATEMFLRNVAHWVRDEALENEVGER